MSARLTATAVEETYAKCADPDGEVAVDGILHSANFNKARLADHAELIAALLLELPDEFKTSGGGGMSFLNACNDRHGEQWTGLHLTMERLFMLGQAISMVTCPMPRELWSVLPGEMPYYTVNDGGRQ